MILVLDNRDSFTFNLAQTLEAQGARVRVERATRVTALEVGRLRPSGVLIGPGPGTPETAGCSEDVVRTLGGDVPILGVCLGHQAIATAHGGRLVREPELCHGQSRAVTHDGRGLFRGLPSPLELTRYNSLMVEDASLPVELVVSARGPNGEIAALRHREHPLEGVQSHPESVLCIDRGGSALLANFLATCGVAAAVPG